VSDIGRQRLEDHRRGVGAGLLPGCAHPALRYDRRVSEPLADIETRDDVLRLVTEFYARAFRDELLHTAFVDVAQMDLEAHLPVITDFWSTMLLGERSYRGGAFAPHARLHERYPLGAQHFRRWLAIWRATVDELFAGPHAELATSRAETIAAGFLKRLEEPDPGPWISVRVAAP
jgi:hemoglobin